jgi:putative ABC transport system permease protein
MRLYELFLRLYPASFRAEYGPELCRLYATRRRNVTSPLSRLGLFLQDALDVLRHAPAAHLDILSQDLRYTARTLARSPVFALTAIAVTALGIGANTAVFSVTDHVLLRPLPYADSNRLVKLWETMPEYSSMEPSPANWRDWRRLATVFEGMGAYTDMSVNLVGEGEPQRLERTAVSSDLLPLLGVRPVMGRLFSADEEREGAAGTAVLSYGLWQEVFGGRRDVLGKVLRLDDEATAVIGVLPQDFAFPGREVQLWTPLRLPEKAFEDRNDNFLEVAARLRPDVTLEQARAQMEVVARQLAKAYPRELAQTGISVIPMHDEVPPQARLLLTALGGAAICVLLIACTNLASLLLARSLGRRRELAVRAALGAGLERLVRQLLTESLVLAFLGGVLGVLLAVPAVPLLEALVPTSLPIGPATALDLRVLGFAAGLTGLTGMAFGVLPALRGGRGADLRGLREGSRNGVGGARQRLCSALVVAEVAAAVVLLVSAGLLIRALQRVQAIDPGFRTEGVMTLRTPLPQPRYASTARREAFYTQVLSQVRSLPGVTNAAYAGGLPMVRRGGVWPVVPQGQPATDNRAAAASASLRFATPGFFDVLGIPLRAGRDVSDTDTLQSPFVAVVSEYFVRKHLQGKDPLGQRFNFAFAERTVVGVVGDIRVRGLERDSEPQVYVPYKQVPEVLIVGYMPRELVYHASSDPAALVPAVREIIGKADPELPISAVRSLESVVDGETAPRRTQLRALGAFAGLALLLAGVGIYGLLAFAVSQRTPEIGVRIALGARPGNILTMVMREGLALAAVGGLAGALLAYVAGSSMQSLLAGVQPHDAATFLASAAVVLLTTVTGSLVPALRALRVDPATALRAE